MRHGTTRTHLCLMFGASWLVLVPLVRLGADEPASNSKSAPVPGSPDAAAKKTYRLAYRFKAGDSVYYQVDQTQEITIQSQAGTEQNNNRSDSRKHFAVTAVDADGSADLELVIDRVHMVMDGGDNSSKIEYDSASKEETPPQFKHIANTIGKPQAKMKFGPSGRLLQIYQGGAAWIPVTKAAPGETPKPTASDGNQTFLLILPEKEIAIGDKWKENFELPVTVEGNLPQPVSAMRTYRLESVENNLATIDMRTAILTPVKEPNIAVQLIQRETTGKIVFDLERGLIVSRTINVDKSVVSPFGAATAMKAVAKTVERLVPGPATAAAETAAKTE